MADCCDIFKMVDESDSFQSWNGLRGPYFVPHLSADGVLSWTNTGNLPNPAPVDISGPPGVSVELRGPVASVQDLPATASSSELWLVGTASPYDGYFFNGVQWENAGPVSVGPPGPAGEDGVSPEMTIAQISGGHSVTITDAEHPSGQSFDVMDGEDGQPGTPGTPGAAAGFGTPMATVDANVGTPSVEISASGPDTAKVFSFAFHNLKGEPGSGGGGPDPYTSNPADLAAAASPGSASQYSRGDHVHKLPTASQIGAYVKPAGGIPASDLASGVIPSVPSASDNNPAMDGTASPGSSGSWARGDHVHPADTNKQNKITASGILKGDGSGGVSAAVAGTDFQAPEAKIAITLSASWTGSGPYTQTVTVSGGTASSIISLQPSIAQSAQLIQDGVQVLQIDNNNGTFTATAIGAAPSSALTLQATRREVAT